MANGYGVIPGALRVLSSFATTTEKERMAKQEAANKQSDLDFKIKKHHDEMDNKEYEFAIKNNLDTYKAVGDMQKNYMAEMKVQFDIAPEGSKLKAALAKTMINYARDNMLPHAQATVAKKGLSPDTANKYIDEVMSESGIDRRNGKRTSLIPSTGGTTLPAWQAPRPMGRRQDTGMPTERISGEGEQPQQRPDKIQKKISYLKELAGVLGALDEKKPAQQQQSIQPQPTYPGSTQLMPTAKQQQTTGEFRGLGAEPTAMPMSQQAGKNADPMSDRGIDATYAMQRRRLAEQRDRDIREQEADIAKIKGGEGFEATKTAEEISRAMYGGRSYNELESEEQVQVINKKYKTSEGALKVATDLRKEFNMLPIVKDFGEIQRKYILMAEAIEAYQGGLKSNVAVDQALVTLFNKITDPQSVVRESEYARTAANISLINKLKGKALKIMKGGAGLTEVERRELVGMAKRFYLASRSSYSEVSNRYGDLSNRYGIEPTLVVTPPTNLPKGINGTVLHSVLPDPTNYTGKIMVDDDTGERYRSTGNEWRLLE